MTLGVSGSNYKVVTRLPRLSGPPLANLPPGNESAIWVEPSIVCTVKYMYKSESGSMRQAIFKGLRNDKEPKDCIE